jgi:hypothetical protein
MAGVGKITYMCLEFLCLLKSRITQCVQSVLRRHHDDRAAIVRLFQRLQAPEPWRRHFQSRPMCAGPFVVMRRKAELD